MKKSFFKVTFIAVLLSFIWGLWWGFYRDYKLRPQKWARGEVHILAEEGRFTPQFIEKFAKDEEIMLRVTTRSSPQEFLRELLSSRGNYDLIELSSFLIDSFIIENVFDEIDRERVTNFENISVDFQNLNFDPEGRHLLPLFWGVNGFVFNSEKLKEFNSINDSLAAHANSIAISPSSVEAYSLAVKMSPIIKTWVNTGNQSDLLKDLKSLSARFPIFSSDIEKGLAAGTISAGQMTNGRAAKFLVDNKNFQFQLPVEKSNLWIGLVGMTKDSQNKKLAQEVMNRLLLPKWSKELVLTTSEATPNSILDSDADILPQQKAQYVRELRLSRFELFYDHETFEPIWMGALRQVFPGTFTAASQ